MIALIEVSLEELQALRDSRTSHRGLERNLLRRYWHRSSSMPVLLVRRGAGSDGTTRVKISGVARIDGGPPLNRSELRRLSIFEVRLLRREVNLDRLLARMPARHATYIRRSVSGTYEVRPLPTGADEALTSAIDEVAPALSEQLRTVPVAPRAVRRSSEEQQVVALERDRLWTVLRWFGLAPSAAMPESDIGGVGSTATRIDLRLSERDAIADDAGSFPGWPRDLYSTHGWWHFRKGERRLLIKNVDSGAVEAATGADIVYLRRSPDAIILVQYKVLEPLGSEVIYRLDSRFPDQVARLSKVDASLREKTSRNSEERYRLNSSVGYVKFVDAPMKRIEPGNLVNGYYMPAEYLSRHWSELLDSGPKGGQILRVPTLRTLKVGAFTGLVNAGFIGSVGRITTTVIDSLVSSVLGGDFGNATVAVDEPIPVDS